VRTSDQLLLQGGVAILLPPDLCVAEEEALVAGKTVDHRRLLPAKRQAVGVVGNEQPGEVGDVLTESQPALDEGTWKRLVEVILPGERVGICLERLDVGGGPPVGQSALRVVLAALVVEMVADLVADNGADPAVIDRVVGMGSKNGGCRIAAGNTISFIVGLA
jgi:hypothetical protein